MFFLTPTVGMVKSISDNCHSTCLGVEPVNLFRKTGSRAEVLCIAIDGVCEVDILACWVDGNIVQRVELATEVVVKDN